MNVFEAVRNNVTARQAAEMYGVKVNRNGMACCPFHADRTPSMKLDKRYHCFGCQADGDAIDFVGKYFEMNPKSAATKIAEDFGIQYKKTHQQKRKPRGRKPTYQQHMINERKRIHEFLFAYHQSLIIWKGAHAPKTAEEEWHPLFTEALEQMSFTEYLLDLVDEEPMENTEELVRFMREEARRIGERLQQLETGGTSENVG